MSQSKLPDFKEVTGMAGKLFNDVKSSITEIIADYKAKRHEESTATTEKTAAQAPDDTTSPSPSATDSTKKASPQAPADTTSSTASTTNSAKDDQPKSE